MKATVTGINLNAKFNGKDCVEFTTQAPPYKGQEKPPRTHKLFRPYANELIAIIETLKVGDNVEYGTDSSQYKNMNSLVKIESQQSSNSTTQKSSGGWKQDDDTQKRISRSAAMKEATSIILFSAKKTATAYQLADDIIEMTKYLEDFLMFKENSKAPNDVPPPTDDEIPF